MRMKDNRNKWIRMLLIITILCAISIASNARKFFASWNISSLAWIEQKVEETCIPSLGYVKNSGNEVEGTWIMSQLSQIVPIFSFAESENNIQQAVEDAWTYEMIMLAEANSENSIDEHGNLIGTEVIAPIVPLEGEDPTEHKIDYERMKDTDYLLKKYYIVDASTSIKSSLFNATKMLEKDMSIKKDVEGPQVLIFHTHSQEAFKDSVPGDSNTTVVGVGAHLAKVLNEQYGIATLHHTAVYDLIDGKLDRSKAYELARPEIQQILKENPSIEVVIDLHRDAAREDTHLVTEIDGKQVGQVMLFNGVSRSKKNGDISYLPNPHIEDNLAFSLQLQIEAEKYYPGYTRKIYLKSYRYNLDLKPKTILLEAGAQTNTVEEMKNSMDIFAKILSNVLTPSNGNS